MVESQRIVVMSKFFLEQCFGGEVTCRIRPPYASRTGGPK